MTKGAILPPKHMGISPSGQQLEASQSAARTQRKPTNHTPFHHHRHTSHRSVHAQHRRSVTATPTSDQLSPLDKVFSQNQQHILTLTFFITSPCTAYTAQSLRRVLPLLYNHFAVYCLYCTITSSCIALTVQSLRSVLSRVRNHFNVYCPYCTIISPRTASTVQSLRRVLPIVYNHFPVYCL